MTLIDLHLSRTSLPIVAALALLTPACDGDGAQDFDYDGDPTGHGAVETGAGDSGTPPGDDTATNDTADDTADDTTDDPTMDDEDESTGDPLEDPACDDTAPVRLFLSPDDSNSMSSPVQVRAAVRNAGQSLAAAPVRVWEFLNYYSFDYPAADPGTLALHTSLQREEAAGDDSSDTDTFTLQIAVTSPHVPNEDRAKMNLTLVLDESGSMSGTPMALQQTTCRVIAGSLRQGDVLSIVGWDTANAVKLAGHEASGPDDPVVVSACDALTAGGGTDLHGGLVAGYGLAQQHYDPSRINRIVLMSDGGANVGITDEALIAEHAGSQDKDGIYMVGVGVGTSGYNDALMDHVTDIGKGASVFIDSPEEAQKIFGERFVSTMAVAARDVQVQLDLPPGFQIVRFSGEEFSATPEEVEPQHIAPNDAMVFHQSIETCAPELAGDDAELTVTARFRDAVTFEEREVTQTVTLGELLADIAPQHAKGAAVFACAEALQHARDAGGTALVPAAMDALATAEALLPSDPDLAELRSVLEAL